MSTQPQKAEPPTIHEAADSGGGRPSNADVHSRSGYSLSTVIRPRTWACENHDRMSRRDGVDGHQRSGLRRQPVPVTVGNESGVRSTSTTTASRVDERVDEHNPARSTSPPDGKWAS